MGRRFPEKYTILIARTGKSPLTLSVRPASLFLALATITLLPLGWLSMTIYTLAQSNRDLAQRNEHLTEAADQVLGDLETLDAEIKDLQERAGISDVDRADSQQEATEGRSEESQGGVSIQLEAEDLFDIAKSRLPQLSAHLYQEVRPALDETLDLEEAQREARPSGHPLKERSRISSNFGLRQSPFGRGYEFHNGIDFPGPIGTPIHATAPGYVEKADRSGGYGYHVIVNHGYGYRTLYAHLSKMNVVQGDRVERNQVIGLLGNTGRSSGPHLHYSIYRNDGTVDPKNYLD